MRFSSALPRILFNLGLVWIIIQPLSFLIVIATVIYFGLRGASDTKTPYIVFLATGYIPWLFFSSSCSQAARAFKKYSYVIKNINIPPLLLLLAIFLSNIFVHAILVGCLIVFLCFYGYFPELLYFHLIYYFVGASIFGLSIGLLTSSIFVVFRDIEKIVAIILQFGFWCTPILWDKSKIPAHLEWAVDFNPMT